MVAFLEDDGAHDPARTWQLEHVLCEFACYRVRDERDPEDMGSRHPDPECEVHWAPGWEGLRTWMYQERVRHALRHRAGRAVRRWLDRG